MEDFDGELLGKRVTLQLVHGEWITGTVAATSRFWLKISVNGRSVYLNKSRIVQIEVEGDG